MGRCEDHQTSGETNWHDSKTNRSSILTVFDNLLLTSNLSRMIIVQAPTYTKDKKGEMASMVRHEEEQMTVDKRGTLTGRLSENHVLEIFVHLR